MGCDLCGALKPTAYVELHHNIGMLFARRVEGTAGHLCRRCVWKSFGDHTLRNLVLGWWGFISFFATLYFLFDNLITAATALRELGKEHERLAPRERKEETAANPGERLEPFVHTIRMRLEDGDAIDDISDDMAQVAAVSAAQAREFVEQLRTER
jgi:hypothetical protein